MKRTRTDAIKETGLRPAIATTLEQPYATARAHVSLLRAAHFPGAHFPGAHFPGVFAPPIISPEC
jgi:hypothetical protein